MDVCSVLEPMEETGAYPLRARVPGDEGNEEAGVGDDRHTYPEALASSTERPCCTISTASVAGSVARNRPSASSDRRGSLAPCLSRLLMAARTRVSAGTPALCAAASRRE